MTLPQPGAPRVPRPVERPATVTPLIPDEPAYEAQVGITGRPMPVFPKPRPLSEHGPAYVLAMCNQKGGVGKTTTTINLGAALAEAGRRVLIVDMDPQGSLSIGLGIRGEHLDRAPTVYDTLMDCDAHPAASAVIPSTMAGLDVLPADIKLSAAELRLAGEVAREYALDRALRPVRTDYDYILIDCQPSLGLLTVNALTAADGVLIPMECEYLALRGVAMLRDTIGKVRERLNDRLVIDGVLPTMVDTRTTHARETVAAVIEMFGQAVFHSAIGRTVKFPETTKEGVSIIASAPTSVGAIAYRNLAWELVDRLESRGAVRN